MLAIIVAFSHLQAFIGFSSGITITAIPHLLHEYFALSFIIQLVLIFLSRNLDNNTIPQSHSLPTAPLRLMHQSQIEAVSQ